MTAHKDHSGVKPLITATVAVAGMFACTVRLAVSPRAAWADDKLEATLRRERIDTCRNLAKGGAWERCSTVLKRSAPAEAFQAQEASPDCRQVGLPCGSCSLSADFHPGIIGLDPLRDCPTLIPGWQPTRNMP